MRRVVGKSSSPVKAGRAALPNQRHQRTGEARTPIFHHTSQKRPHIRRNKRKRNAHHHNRDVQGPEEGVELERVVQSEFKLFFCNFFTNFVPSNPNL